MKQETIIIKYRRLYLRFFKSGRQQKKDWSETQRTKQKKNDDLVVEVMMIKKTSPGVSKQTKMEAKIFTFFFE